MRFFSKLVVICNVCFLLSVLLRFAEMLRQKPIHVEGTVFWNPITSTLVILGYGAVFLNVVFCLISTFLLIINKFHLVGWKLFLFNLILLLCQGYYFFF